MVKTFYSDQGIHLSEGQRSFRIEHFLHQALRYVNTDSHHRTNDDLKNSPFGLLFANKVCHREEEIKRCGEIGSRMKESSSTISSGEKRETRAGNNNNVSNQSKCDEGKSKCFQKNSKCVSDRAESLPRKEEFQNSIAEVNTFTTGQESETIESITDVVAEERKISIKEWATPSVKKGKKESSSQRHHHSTSQRITREGTKIKSPTTSAGGLGRRTKLSSQTIINRASNMSKGKRKGLVSEQIVVDSNVLSQRGEDFIIMSGPIGIKNSGWQCHEISVFRAMQSLRLVLEDLTNMFTQVFIEKKRGHFELEGKKALDMCLLEEETILKVYVPLASGFVALGNEVDTAMERRQKMIHESKSNSIQTRNTHPSICFDTFHELSSQFIQRIEKKSDSQEGAAKFYFLAVIRRLRAEIYTQNGCDIGRHFLMVTKEGKKCVQCSTKRDGNKAQWIWSENIDSQCAVISVRNPPFGCKIKEEELVHHGLFHEDGIYHLEDLYTMKQKNFWIPKIDSEYKDSFSCEMCNSEKYYQNETVVHTSPYVVIAIERSVLQKINVSGGTSTGKKEWKYMKDKRPIYIPNIFKITTNNGDTVEYVFKNAICFTDVGSESSSNPTHFYVLKRVGPGKGYPVKICDGVITQLTDFHYAKVLFDHSSLLFYERKRIVAGKDMHEVEEETNGVEDVCGMVDYSGYPPVPDMVANHLTFLKNKPIPRRKIANNSRLNPSRVVKPISPHTELQLKCYDFSKDLVCFVNDCSNRTPPKYSGRRIVSQKLFSKEQSEKRKPELINQIGANVSHLLMEKGKNKKRSSTSVSQHDTIPPRGRDVKKRKKNSQHSKRQRNQKWLKQYYNRGKMFQLEDSQINKGSENSVVEDLQINDQVIDGLVKFQSSVHKPYDDKSKVEIHSSQGTITCAHDDVRKSCVYCLKDTTAKIGSYLFICEECSSTNEMDDFSKSVAIALKDDVRKKAINYSCIHCSNVLDSNINMHHKLGTFLFCETCIKGKECKCTVCKSDRFIHHLAEKNIQSKEPFISGNSSSCQHSPGVPLDSLEGGGGGGPNHLDSFLSRDMTAEEVEIFGFLFAENNCVQSKKQYCAHSRDTWVNFEDLQQLGKVCERSKSSQDHGSGTAAETFYVDSTAYILNSNVISHYVTLMMDEMRENIFFYQAEVGADLEKFESELQQFVRTTYGFLSRSIFGMKNVFFMIQTVSKHWLVVELSTQGKNAITLTFLDTELEDTDTKNPSCIQRMEKVFRSSWNTMQMKVPAQFKSDLKMDIVNISRKSPNGEGDSDIYALFMLRDWVYSTSSQRFKRKNIYKLVQYMVLCIIHKTAKYY